MLTYYARWKKALESGSNTMQDRLPWLSFPAITYLESHVNSTDKVFEYGGGGSTLFWIDRVAEVVTVEHDKEWFDLLREKLLKEKGAKWEGNHVKAASGELVSPADPSEPVHYASTDKASKGKNFKAYATVIDNFDDSYFDTVLVDGRARTACLHHAVPKLRSGGLLILDNAERAHYTEKNQQAIQQLEVVLSGMAPCLHSRDFSETRIYRKR